MPLRFYIVIAVALLWIAACAESERVELAAVDDVASEGAILAQEDYWIVALGEGSYRAFENQDPHSSCPLRWISPEEARNIFVPAGSETARGVLRDTCLGSSYTPEGERFFGPSPRGLRQLPIVVKEGKIFLEVE